MVSEAEIIGMHWFPVPEVKFPPTQIIIMESLYFSIEAPGGHTAAPPFGARQIEDCGPLRMIGTSVISNLLHGF